ncbi:type-F conjugative transfer system secretin TraK [Noviherbaspirillum sp. CPCC 100848]|uniref:Type-F conjugative transfer system secretin TraK n=1 Tax=Noviherbaspirillum album TaxID=3080276 RepID=A0ABU6JAY7_9BURK|nr:type-F conjugative transfer system secretin TraK [Noviherbaspirillum sp. CPCC 100848]MEC4720475.1 type-F conjugative transfer system secretin TraK [Noviherbaspirillum sp. CPCC 100848]
MSTLLALVYAVPFAAMAQQGPSLNALVSSVPQPGQSVQLTAPASKVAVVAPEVKTKAGQTAPTVNPASPTSPNATPASNTRALPPRLDDPAPKPAARKFTEEHLPGLGMMPGDKQGQKAVSVRVSSDRNEIVYVSTDFTNRIATPFAAPKMIDQGDLNVDYVGQSVYVTVNSTKPSAVFVTGSNPNDPVVSLTLVPKNLPPQTINLQLDTPAPSYSGSDVREEAPTGNAYTDRIKFLMRQVALGKAPEGFSLGKLPRAAARMGDIVVFPESRYSGPTYDIYKYRVETTTPNTIELDEGSFYTEGVRAVAFYPTAVIGKAEATSVLVISDKTAVAGGQ